MKFIESVLFKNGVYHQLTLHQKRIDQTFLQQNASRSPFEIKKILPKKPKEGVFKTRIIYGINQEDPIIEQELYTPRSIKSLQLVNAQAFDYSLKYADRTEINRLKMQQAADDIIICFESKITDSSYANLAFFNGSTWYTPKKPLLNGVRRQHLLATGKINEKSLQISDLPAFEKVSLINAMLDLEEICLSTKAIALPKSDD